MKKEEYQEILDRDPGSPLSVDYALYLKQSEQYEQASKVLISALSANPSLHKARLLLAQVYYLQGYKPFAIRELVELNQLFPHNQSVVKLLERLGAKTELRTDKGHDLSANLNDLSASGTIPNPEEDTSAAKVKAQVHESQETVAEVEIEFEALDLIESEEEKKN